MLTPDEDRTEDEAGQLVGDDEALLEGHADPAPITRFQRTAVGSMFAAGLLGIQEALEPPKDNTPAIVESWGGLPLDDDMVLRLDPDNPQDSIVMLRRPSATDS